ncbi:MAG: phosphoribosyltransferase [Saprospiraceae bacterium]|nr:phosphoribosyltransferase [Saprospiraceae bacterium]
MEIPHRIGTTETQPGKSVGSSHHLEIKNVENLADKTVIVVDDVANTGRTIFYGFKPFMEILPYKS